MPHLESLPQSGSAEDLPPALLLVRVNSVGKQGLRSLRCYRYADQQLLWEQPLAAAPDSSFHYQDDKIGFQLVTSSRSPCNGLRLDDGTDDGHSYVRAYSRDGKTNWQQAVGDGFSRCQVQRATIDGSNYLYVLAYRSHEAWLQSTNQWPAFGRVIKLSPAGVNLVQYDFDCEVSSMLLADLSGSGRPSLYLGDSRGWLHVLDANLKPQTKMLITSTSKNWVSLHLEAAADLDGDGRLELVLESVEVEFVSGTNPGDVRRETNERLYHHRRLLVYDSRLRQVASRELVPRSKDPCFGKAVVLPANSDGTRDLLLLAQRAIVLHLEPKQMPRSLAMNHASGL